MTEAAIAIDAPRAPRNGVIVDARGYAYFSGKNQGLYVVRSRIQ